MPIHSLFICLQAEVVIDGRGFSERFEEVPQIARFERDEGFLPYVADPISSVSEPCRNS